MLSAIQVETVDLIHALYNSNISDSKDSIFSLKTLGLGWLIPARASRESLKEDRALEKSVADDAPVNMHKRHWWGSRKRQRPSAVPRSAPGGGDLQSAREKGGKPDNSGRTNANGYEDLRDDDDTDASPYGKGASWDKTTWENLRTGDFVKLINNEAVPAGELRHAIYDRLYTDCNVQDIVICSSSEEEDVVYVETKNLDGETNLKSRHAVPELNHLRSAAKCVQAKFSIDADAPNVDMFKYNGAVHLADGRLDKAGKDPLRAPVSLNTVLLRGTVIRNTEWVIGVVMATGVDTKIILNSGLTPSKRSKVERQMNPQVYVAISAQIMSFD